MSDAKRFALSRPEGTGLLESLEKGGRAFTAHRRPGARETWELRAEGGCLAVPDGLEKKLGLEPGVRLEVVLDGPRVEIRPNIHSLNRLVIEPTSRCNLACRTCIRNTWRELAGDMDEATFDRIAGEFGRFPHLETVMFGGFGEPTAHPRLLDMIGAVKAAGLRAELTTNATLLDEDLVDGLLREGLDTLWISLDGTTAESFDAIRAGASLPGVLENIERLARRNSGDPPAIDIGIAFVVMKTNLQDVKHLDRLARAVGARRILVSHVLPYTEAMEKEMLCLQTLTLETFTFAPGKTELDLPRIDVNDLTKDTLFSLFQGFENLRFMGHRVAVDARRCRFVNERMTFVRWDGAVSPCMGLLHSHTTYLYGLERQVRAHAFGNVHETGLAEIWASPDYAAFRDKVKRFDFSPCHVCGGCSLLEKNEEDCYGNAFPTCGGCLWAEGIIQCP